jgi:hypothetical protein
MDLHDSASRIMIESCMRRTRESDMEWGESAQRQLGSLQGSTHRLSAARVLCFQDAVVLVGIQVGGSAIPTDSTESRSAASPSSFLPRFTLPYTFTDPARLYQAILEVGTRSLHSYPQMRIRELSYPAISTRTVNPPVDCSL